MKYEFALIDDNGMWVKDVSLTSLPMISQDGEDGDIILVPDPHYVRRCTGGGFYHPKWNGEKWIEGKTQEEIDLILSVKQPITETEKLWDAINYLISSGYEV